MRCLDYVVDTRVRKKSLVTNVSVVREFADVLPADLLDVPPERQV